MSATETERPEAPPEEPAPRAVPAREAPAKAAPPEPVHIVPAAGATVSTMVAATSGVWSGFGVAGLVAEAAVLGAAGAVAVSRGRRRRRGGARRVGVHRSAGAARLRRSGSASGSVRSAGSVRRSGSGSVRSAGSIRSGRAARPGGVRSGAGRADSGRLAGSARSGRPAAPRAGAAIAGRRAAVAGRPVPKAGGSWARSGGRSGGLLGSGRGRRSGGGFGLLGGRRSGSVRRSGGSGSGRWFTPSRRGSARRLGSGPLGRLFGSNRRRTGSATGSTRPRSGSIRTGRIARIGRRIGRAAARIGRPAARASRAGTRRFARTRLGSRLARAWRAAATPRGWWPRMVDPFWQARYGRLRPWERDIVHLVLKGWAVAGAALAPLARRRAQQQAWRRAIRRWVGRPEHTRITRDTGGAGQMSAEQQALQEAAEAFAEAFAQYGATVPMEEYGKGLAAMAPALRQVSEGITNMAQRMREEDPVEEVVIEGVEDVGANLYSAADVAEELDNVFEQAHERELERLRNPRRGEERWDVTQQDGQ